MLYKNIYLYSTDRLALNREIYSLKVCYRKHLNFLRKHTNISRTISNKISKNSNFHYSFKTLNSFYITYLRDFILINNRFSSSMFSLTYRKNIALNDLNRALLWVATKNLPIFKIKLENIKKKKI